jgi:hypothetical protein
MGFIKEPLNIDFYVMPEPLTDKEKDLISQYILQYKIKHKRKRMLIKKSVKSKQNA